MYPDRPPVTPPTARVVYCPCKPSLYLYTCISKMIFLCVAIIVRVEWWVGVGVDVWVYNTHIHIFSYEGLSACELLQEQFKFYFQNMKMK